jgi:hypothetical protein
MDGLFVDPNQRSKQIQFDTERTRITIFNGLQPIPQFNREERLVHSKAKLHMQAEQQDEQEDNKSTIDNASARSNRSSRISWSGLLIPTSIEKESLYNDDQEMGSRLRNWITLDNGSTLSLFSNPDIVEDIQTSTKTLVLATNAGVTQSNKEATVPGFGKVCSDKDVIADIFGLSDLKKKYRVTYDSEKEDAFLIPFIWRTRLSSLNAALKGYTNLHLVVADQPTKAQPSVHSLHHWRRPNQLLRRH